MLVVVTPRHRPGAPGPGKCAPLAKGRGIRLFGVGALWSVSGTVLAHGDPFTMVVVTITQLFLVGLVVLIPVVLVRAMFSPAGRREVSRLMPGLSIRAEVLRIMGSPSLEWQEPDGHVTWEYAQSRECPVTYLLRFTPDGTLSNVREVHNRSRFGELRLGLTQEAVQRLLGSPDSQAQDSDSAATWVFAGRYADGVTRLLRFGPDQTLAEIRILVPKDHFAEVTAGMDRRAVEDLLGLPDAVIASESATDQTLCWRYEDERGDWREFRVRLDLHGRVAEITHLQRAAASGAS